MKNEILEILQNNAKEGWNGDVEAIGYVDFEKVAEELSDNFLKNISKLPVKINNLRNIKVSIENGVITISNNYSGDICNRVNRIG